MPQSVDLLEVLNPIDEASEEIPEEIPLEKRRPLIHQSAKRLGKPVFCKCQMPIDCSHDFVFCEVDGCLCGGILHVDCLSQRELDQGQLITCDWGAGIIPEDGYQYTSKCLKLLHKALLVVFKKEGLMDRVFCTRDAAGMSLQKIRDNI